MADSLFSRPCGFEVNPQRPVSSSDMQIASELERKPRVEQLSKAGFNGNARTTGDNETLRQKVLELTGQNANLRVDLEVAIQEGLKYREMLREWAILEKKRINDEKMMSLESERDRKVQKGLSPVFTSTCAGESFVKNKFDLDEMEKHIRAAHEQANTVHQVLREAAQAYAEKSSVHTSISRDLKEAQKSPPPSLQSQPAQIEKLTKAAADLKSELATMTKAHVEKVCQLQVQLESREQRIKSLKEDLVQSAKNVDRLQEMVCIKNESETDLRSTLNSEIKALKMGLQESSRKIKMLEEEAVRQSEEKSELISANLKVKEEIKFQTELASEIKQREIFLKAEMDKAVEKILALKNEEEIRKDKILALNSQLAENENSAEWSRLELQKSKQLIENMKADCAKELSESAQGKQELMIEVVELRRNNSILGEELSLITAEKQQVSQSLMLAKENIAISNQEVSELRKQAIQEKIHLESEIACLKLKLAEEAESKSELSRLLTAEKENKEEADFRIFDDFKETADRTIADLTSRAQMSNSNYEKTREIVKDVCLGLAKEAEEMLVQVRMLNNYLTADDGMRSEVVVKLREELESLRQVSTLQTQRSEQLQQTLEKSESAVVLLKARVSELTMESEAANTAIQNLTLKLDESGGLQTELAVQNQILGSKVKELSAVQSLTNDSARDKDLQMLGLTQTIADLNSEVQNKELAITELKSVIGGLKEEEKLMQDNLGRYAITNKSVLQELKEIREWKGQLLTQVEAAFLEVAQVINLLEGSCRQSLAMEDNRNRLLSSNTLISQELSGIIKWKDEYVASLEKHLVELEQQALLAQKKYVMEARHHEPHQQDVVNLARFQTTDAIRHALLTGEVQPSELGDALSLQCSAQRRADVIAELKEPEKLARILEAMEIDKVAEAFILLSQMEKKQLIRQLPESVRGVASTAEKIQVLPAPDRAKFIKAMGRGDVSTVLSWLSPVDLGAACDLLSITEFTEIFRIMSEECRLATLVPMKRASRLAALHLLSVSEATQLIQRLSPAEATSCLHEISVCKQAHVILSLPAEDRVAIEQALTASEMSCSEFSATYVSNMTLGLGFIRWLRPKVLAKCLEHEKECEGLARLLNSLSDDIIALVAAELLAADTIRVLNELPKERCKSVLSLIPKELLASIFSTVSQDQVEVLVTKLPKPTQSLIRGAVAIKMMSPSERAATLLSMSSKALEDTMQWLTPQVLCSYLMRMSDAERQRILTSLSPGARGSVFEGMNAVQRAVCFCSLSPAHRTTVLRTFTPDQILVTVAAMSGKDQNMILTSMPTEERTLYLRGKEMDKMPPAERSQALGSMDIEDSLALLPWIQPRHAVDFLDELSFDQRSRLLEANCFCHTERPRCWWPLDFVATLLMALGIEEALAFLALMRPSRQSELLALLEHRELAHLLAAMPGGDRRALLEGVSYPVERRLVGVQAGEGAQPESLSPARRITLEEAPVASTLL